MEWFPSHCEIPGPFDAEESESETERWWTEWSGKSAYDGKWSEEVMRSLITLKALTHSETGGMVAAPTTSLPESPGGSHNWDYRYCWLRDSTSTLEALLVGGYDEEARAWRDWLFRSVAGDPGRTQIMYGLAGERRVDESEIPWLPGHAGSRPVRVGNEAWRQFQLDVYGELLDAMLQARYAGVRDDPHWWEVEVRLTEFLEGNWRRPGAGIWEARRVERRFTHAKVMAWAGLDRAISTVEEFDLEGPVDRWRKVRDEIKQDVLRNHFDTDLGAFVQFPGSDALDASLLLMPLMGFLPARDERVVGTVKAVEERLLDRGLIRRYERDPDGDESAGEEGAFLACTLWYADVLELMGRQNDAHEAFERVLGLQNDVGLLSEEFDPGTGRMLGNFPQAFSHQWLVLVARNLSGRPERGRHTAGPL
jgi:GH15 family glucan-1,4-alpha-glucosidase